MKTQPTQSTENSTSSSATPPKSDAASKRKPPVDPLKVLAESIRSQVKPNNGADAEELGDDDETGEQGEPPRKPGKPSKSKAPKNLDALAEALGLGVDELYTVEIPAKAKGAKPYTLGALKDLAAADSDFQVKKLKLDTDRSALEAERVAAEAELQAVLSALPADAIKPEAMQKLRGVIAQKHGKERARVLEVIPEWQDEAVRTAELKGVIDFARTQYGLPDSYLVTHMDHRLVRLMRDAWRNATMIKKALEEVEEVKTPTPPKANAGSKPAPKRNGEAPRGRRAGEVGRFMETIISAARQ